MSEIVLHIPAVPVAQPRQRHAIRGKHAVSYLPKEHPVHVFKAACKMTLRESYQGAPLTGSLTVQIEFVMPRPERLNKKKLAPWGRAPHVQTPDADNLIKSTFDALNELAWVDDSQVTELLVSKVHAARDESPHVRMVITEQASAMNC
jgi:Holliday junction resolvase RusA-like endonuclease